MIKELRKQFGLTRQQFCELLDIPYKTLQKWELGERRPPAYLIKLIEFYLNNKLSK